MFFFFFFFFNDTATTEIYTLSLHDALPICPGPSLITASSGHAPRQPSHSQQLPHDRQRRASYVASRSDRPPTTSPKSPVRCSGGVSGCCRRAASPKYHKFS